jgi:hypothetical protein
MTKVGKYFKNVLIALDQFGNALVGGDPQETISSRLGKSQVKCATCHNIAYFLCRILSWIDRRHCFKSINPNEGSDQIR